MNEKLKEQCDRFNEEVWNAIEQYISFHPDSVCMDGWFKLEDLRMIIEKLEILQKESENVSGS